MTEPGGTHSPRLPLQWPLVGRHEDLDAFSAALADPRAHGFVIHGPSGVGKTRLADQCLALATRAGRNVSRATATEGSQSVPLGALAHLLPAEIATERCDLVAVVSAVRPVLAAQFTNGPMVLCVDDLHLLDSTSATLVGQLVDADLVFLVATVRTEETLPSGLESLWHRARVHRVDLLDLDQASVETLLHMVLHGPVEASTAAGIWSASQGNVLFVRELVLGAIASGHLEEQHGVWRLTGPLVSTRRLHELVASRLRALPRSAIDALHVLAVCETVGLATLASIVGIEPLELLDRAGIIDVQIDRRRERVRLAQPLYGEVLREQLAGLTRRRLLLEHVERIEAHGARRRGDTLRIAAAQLDASAAVDPELLVRAARLARYGHDFRQVERFSRAALAHGMTPEVGLLLGEALVEVGTHDEADAVLSAAELVAIDDPLRVHITEIRTRNLMWGMWRADEALAVNRAALEELPAAHDAHDAHDAHEARLELRLNEAMLLAYGGRPLEARAVLDGLDDSPAPRARAMRAVSEVPTMVATGRSVSAVDAAARAFTEQSAMPEQIAIPVPGVHVIMQVYGLAESGRLADAAALAGAAYDATAANGPPDGLMWLCHGLGRCALLSGRPATARRWLSEALARCESQDIRGPRTLVLSLLATAHAQLGDVAAAAAAVRTLDSMPPFAFVRPEQDLGRAWALVAAGDLPAARTLLRAAADGAAATGYRTAEAWLLHDLARLGEPKETAPRLAELAATCEGELVAAYAVHASAAASGRSSMLAASVDGFERIGANLLAAEAANETAQAFQREGDGRAAAAWRARAASLADASEGAQTPALSSSATVSPLTRRERDIAVLAAQGAPSKDIAARLYLSVRTVNNHLQNVYSKLGVSGRRELDRALQDVGEVSATTAPGARRPASLPR